MTQTAADRTMCVDHPPVVRSYDGQRLPRLLLLSDCSAEASVAGQLLLYRLLKGCEPNELTVVDGDVWPTDPARHLPDVPYHTLRYRPPAFNTRLWRYWNTWLLGSIERWTGWASNLARERRAEAVLTVAHGHLWILAAAVARRLNIPLHLILHDDWPTITPVAPGFTHVLHRRFAAIYRQAASRFCVSPFMEAEYRRRYGCEGTVLLPSRLDEMPAGRVRVRSDRSRFTLAYAGSLPNADYPERLRRASDAVAGIGGTLDLYTNADRARLAAEELIRPEVQVGGFLPSRILVDRLGETADALFLPMSFRPEDRDTVQVAFPSKLTDYTAVGLPILIWAPEYSSAARWAAENVSAALCVTDSDPAAFSTMLRQVAGDFELRRRLAAGAVAAGERDFSFSAAAAVFRSRLLAGQRR